MSRLFSHAADAVVYRAGEHVFDAATLGGGVRALAARLPDKRHVLNLCEDRLLFMTGFGAALLRGQITLLPGQRARRHLADLLDAYPDTTLLVDDPAMAAGYDAIRLDAEDARNAPPDPVPLAINPETPAAVLFTSGTTGAPTAHLKTWGMLTQGAHLLARALGIANDFPQEWVSAARHQAPAEPRVTLLGSVPQQHMFGLESTVLLPLQNGCVLASGCPLLPQDILHALQQLPAPAWWIATPLHLRACVESGLRFPQLAGVLSATQTLAPALAQAAEACFQAPLHEIYGSTEAGMIGLRRPATAAAWTLCADLEMTQSQNQTFISGKRSGDRLALHDAIEPLPERQFLLHGRHDRLIKVGGKRMDLDALNRLVLALPGVVDGVFMQRADGERLQAFIVAPSLTRAQLLDALRERLDPVFLPRPLHLLPALPRDALGKLSRAALLELAAAPTPPDA